MMVLRKLSIAIIIAAVIAAVFLTVATSGLLNTSQTVPYSGTVTAVNLALYSDSDLTQSCTAITAGTVSPGGTATQTIYVKNTGTVSETLTMAVNSWNPANAGSSLTLTWDRQNYVLAEGQSIQATLTLTAASNCGSLTTFSCSATFTGTQ